MRKIEREYRKLFATEGIEITSTKVRSGHFAFSTEYGTVFCAGSPSDRRNLRNVQANVRRLKRG